MDPTVVTFELLITNWKEQQKWLIWAKHLFFSECQPGTEMTEKASCLVINNTEWCKRLYIFNNIHHGYIYKFILLSWMNLLNQRVSYFSFPDVTSSCTGCRGCTGCRECTGCSACTGWIGFTGCIGCIGSTGCESVDVHFYQRIERIDKRRDVRSREVIRRWRHRREGGTRRRGGGGGGIKGERKSRVGISAVWKNKRRILLDILFRRRR